MSDNSHLLPQCVSGSLLRELREKLRREGGKEGRRETPVKEKVEGLREAE